VTKEEKEKLVKLLNLTTSDSDGEALNAIRAANRILKKYDLTFGDVIALPARPDTEGPTPPAYNPPPHYWPPTTSDPTDWINYIRQAQGQSKKRYSPF